MSSKRLWAVAVAAVLSTGCITVVERPDDAEDRSVSQDEYSEVLSPHGEWLYVPGYGRVWRPHRHVVGPDFMPYSSGGRWVYSNVGWVFESDWDWGYVPFHYGNWHYSGGYGWVWVPGYRWAPAWVYWRSGGGYIGWTPIPPGRGYVHAHHHWHFVDSHYIGHRHVRRYRIDPDKARVLFHEATPVHRATGPSPQRLVSEARASGRDLDISAIPRAKGNVKGANGYAGFDRGGRERTDGDRWSPPPGKNAVDGWTPGGKSAADDRRTAPPGEAASDEGWSSPRGKDASRERFTPPPGKDATDEGWSPRGQGASSERSPPSRAASDEGVPSPRGRADRSSPPPGRSDSDRPRYSPPPANERPRYTAPPARERSAPRSSPRDSGSSRSGSSRSSGWGAGKARR